MNQEFRIQTHSSSGNLHVSVFGVFNGMCAWELFKILMRQKTGVGRVFINTRGICKIEPVAERLFKHHMPRSRIPQDWLYFKGEKGFQIAPDGSRVLIRKKESCRQKPEFKNPDEIIEIIHCPDESRQPAGPIRRKK